MEEVKKEATIILPSNDSKEQHESPHEQDKAPEVASASMPNKSPYTPIVTTEEEPWEELWTDTFAPQSPELQRDPDRTTTSVDEAGGTNDGITTRGIDD